MPLKRCKKMLPCVQKVYRSLCPHDCSYVFQNNNASIKAVIENTAKWKDTLSTELSVGSTSSSVLTNLNSPKLAMGFGALNAPTVLFVISVMLTGGLVAALLDENSVPSSVPASHGGNMVTFILSRHLPLLHISRLSIPMNQSGEGANIVIIDTLVKFALTWTPTPVCFDTGPSRGPPGRISLKALFAAICVSISLFRVPVWPENKIIH